MSLSEYEFHMLADGSRIEWIRGSLDQDTVNRIKESETLGHLLTFLGRDDFVFVPPPSSSFALSTQVDGTHYKHRKIQPIEYCEANRLGACESAIVKYITRWREKGGMKDLEKIKHYVDLLIETEQRYHGWNPQDNTWNPTEG